MVSSTKLNLSSSLNILKESNGLGSPTTEVKALTGETVMKSGPPISHPDRSTQNLNTFLKDPTVLDSRRFRANTMARAANDFMVNMNKMIPDSNPTGQNNNLPAMVSMMMNMMSNVPNMATVMADSTARTDMVNALSSATEIMSKMQNNMNTNRNGRLRVQSRTETPRMLDNTGYMSAMTGTENMPNLMEVLSSNVQPLMPSNNPSFADMMKVLSPTTKYMPTENYRPSNMIINPRRE